MDNNRQPPAQSTPPGTFSPFETQNVGMAQDRKKSANKLLAGIIVWTLVAIIGLIALIFFFTVPASVPILGPILGLIFLAVIGGAAGALVCFASYHKPPSKDNPNTLHLGSSYVTDESETSEPPTLPSTEKPTNNKSVVFFGLNIPILVVYIILGILASSHGAENGYMWILVVMIWVLGPVQLVSIIFGFTSIQHSAHRVLSWVLAVIALLPIAAFAFFIILGILASLF